MGHVCLLGTAAACFLKCWNQIGHHLHFLPLSHMNGFLYGAGFLSEQRSKTHFGKDIMSPDIIYF